jgi:nucleotide-binding universal stress UspA family protein
MAIIHERPRSCCSSTNVLCPIDFSEISAEVLEPSPFDPCHQALADSRRRRQQLEHARKRLHAQFAPEATAWCEIEAIVASDRACKAILRHADETKADLIIMGAQGTAGLELMLYGSNTQHVLRAATCPVLTLRA